jgi:hypothetical protein
MVTLESSVTVFPALIVSPRADPFLDVLRRAFSAGDSQRFLDEARQRLSDCFELSRWQNQTGQVSGQSKKEEIPPIIQITSAHGRTALVCARRTGPSVI